MTPLHRRARRPAPLTALALAVALALVAGACSSDSDDGATSDSTTATTTSLDTTSTTAGIDVVEGMPAVVDPSNLYSETGADDLDPARAGLSPRVYVPNGLSNTVSVIDPSTKQIIATFETSSEPQHIVPSYDGKTLWVLDNQGYDVIPIDAVTGAVGEPIPVEDPYNLYFTPDGKDAIVVAEAKVRLDFRDPQTMELRDTLAVPGCDGINHIDFSIDGSYLLATCEFAGKVAKIDWRQRVVVGLLDLSGPSGMPQDIRVSADGSRFYVADMREGGIHVVDGEAFTKIGFIATGVGAHGLYPSRDGTQLYVANRGSSTIGAPPGGAGSVSVVDFATDTVVANWPVPDGGSPDMGNVSADGTELWLAGRYDSEVYVFDTVSGALKSRIPVGNGPHGLTWWPQPGRYSLGHTGNMR